MVVLVAIESIGSSLFTLALNLSKLGTSTGFYALDLHAQERARDRRDACRPCSCSELAGLSLFVGHVTGGMVGARRLARDDVAVLRAADRRRRRADALSLGGWSTISLLFLQARQTIERAWLSRYLGLYELGIYTHAQQYQSLRDARHPADPERRIAGLPGRGQGNGPALRAAPHASPTSCFSASPCSVSAPRCSGARSSGS